ncbi:MAG TPA: GNAT family N-acetyltransferase [Feifaniaceae bacterium]|nr:GNAT family N-acetyltransferase [Feifaniaceae bacterium]
MDIRLARAEDADAAYALMCDMEAARLDEAAFRRIYADMLHNPMSPCLAAGEEGDIIGFLHLRMEEQLCRCGRVAEVMELIVRSDVRSRGVGARLLGEAKRLAGENGCIRLEAASNMVRERAHAFYRKQGMETTHVKLTMRLE